MRIPLYTIPKFFSGFLFISCLIVALFLCTIVLAQPAPMKWGKVSDDELTLKVCAYDSTATAIVLCDYGDVTFNYGSFVTINRHIRIKILDRSAIDRANILLPYYVENDLEKITNIKAQTINKNAQGKLTFTEVESNQIFDVKENEKWHQKRFSMPLVSEGSIIEYKYSTLSKNVTFLEGWVFQTDIPTLHSEFKAMIGQDLDYRILYQGARLLKNYRDKTTNRWVLQNLPALKDEPYVANYMDYAEKIRFQLAGYYKKADGIAGGIEYTTTMTSWEKLAGELLSHESYTSYLNRQGIANNILESIIKPSDTDEGKLQKIYNYVKTNVRWDNKHRMFIEKKLPDLIQSKQGNSAEINLLLTLLLKEAGLQAHPVLISTREHGKVQKAYPMLSQFNHLVVHVQLADKSYILNATDPLRSHKLLDKEDLNLSGFLLDKEKARWIEIAPVKDTKQIVALTVDLKDTKNPVYKLDIIYRGYMAVDKRREFLSLGQEDFIKKNIAAIFTDFKLKEFKNTSLEEIDQDFSTSYTYTSDDLINTDNKMMYIQPMLVNNFKESPFKYQVRYLPVEFNYPVSYNYILNLYLPEGYQVQEIPKPMMMRMPDNMAEFRYDIKQNGQQVQLSTNVSIKTDFILNEYYPHLQEFYGQILSKYNEMIVAQKK